MSLFTLIHWKFHLFFEIWRVCWSKLQAQFKSSDFVGSRIFQWQFIDINRMNVHKNSHLAITSPVVYTLLQFKWSAHKVNQFYYLSTNLSVVLKSFCCLVATAIFLAFKSEYMFTDLAINGQDSYIFFSALTLLILNFRTTKYSPVNNAIIIRH